MLGHKVMGAGLNTLAVLAITQDTATSLSAAGTTQGTATELTATDNEITTVAANAGVILASKLAPGDEQTVYNAGANPLKIYPPSGMLIRPLSANTAMTLAVNSGCLFKCASTTIIYGILSA
jgi:hypothetical protein